MEKIDILLWAVGGGFTITFGLILIVWKTLREEMGLLRDELNKKIDKLDEKLTDIDRRLCRLEGAFASKDCCMIKDHRIYERAE